MATPGIVHRPPKRAEVEVSSTLEPRALKLTRDRVRLYADIYRPDAEGEFPVLLMRQPYGRAIAPPKFCCL